MRKNVALLVFLWADAALAFVVPQVAPIRRAPAPRAQVTPDAPATAPVFGPGQPEAAAAQFGVTLAENQESLFEKNFFSSINGAKCRLVRIILATTLSACA